MSTRPVVIQAEHLSAPAAAWAAHRAELIACRAGDAGFDESLARAAGLVVRTYTRVDESLLARAPMLRVVGRAGAGLDNIDVPACRARGVEVVYTPDANTQAVVEFVVCLLGDALRPRERLTAPLDADEWRETRERLVGARQMNLLTLGILGLGRVGRGVARAASGLGFRVLYNDLLEIPRSQRRGVDPVTAPELFERSDIVTIHIDGRESNRAFVNKQLIGRLKPQAILINTSRGFVVDNFALEKFLRGHPQALALLDVHEPEPFGPDYPLLGLANAWLYPHLASRTQQAMENMSWVVKDVMAVLDGGIPQFPAPSIT